MDSVRKFMIYGPSDTLQMFAGSLADKTKPQYHFAHHISETGHVISVFIYEEHRKLINSSTTVTALIKTLSDKIEIDFVITGGRMGFRGSSASSDNIEPLIQDVVYGFIVEFSGRFGLTIQESKTTEDTDADA
ncbi:MAG: hypothetical protein LAT75_01480 [Candidatus Cyclonatronum sp.]|uniref:hypothetical protein n=1 Tax=Cyclonatronum sp. TaxID=3024185 RepID=UPI0025C37A59|nr:hypothetical protein [Cyclonatronum sp.]MCC5934603.1 hypothetical protein [Balneolales bacterium]MCH8485502.1 hypothetical protein [Cyclonatronum sp.]